MPHVDDGVLHAYLDGELAGAERDRLLVHLEECPPCRLRLDEERALVARADELLGRAMPRTRAPAAFPPVQRARKPSWRVPAAWAATVTIAFASGWYAQGERIAHEGIGEVTAGEPAAPAAVAKAKGTVAPRRVAPTPAAPGIPSRADAPALRGAYAPASPAAAQTEPPRNEAARSLELDADGARAVLGRAPALLPGRVVRRMSRSQTDAGVVVIEQEWEPGIVVRLYERQAMAAAADAVRPSAGRARSVPSAATAFRGEDLARYVNSLRVEIEGPLAADSLAQLLDLVQ